MTIEEGIVYGKEQLKVFGGKYAEFIKMTIHALEMQKKLAKFSGMDICNWIEDYDYDEPREMTIVAESKEKAEGIAKANAYNPNSVWEAKEVDLNKEQILTIDILEG